MITASRLKAVALVAVVLAGLGAFFPVDRPADAAPRPTETREPQILFWVKGKAVLLKPDGTVVKLWEGEQVAEATSAKLCPDGTRIAIVRGYEERTLKTKVPIGGGASLPGSFGRTLCKLTLVPVADELKGTNVGVPGDSVYTVFWSADGTKLYAGSHDDDPSYAQLNNLRHWVIDAKTLKVTELKLPEGHHLLDVSGDGKLFLTQGPPPKALTARPIWVVPADGSKPIRLTDTNEGAFDGRLSPDGTRVLLCGSSRNSDGSQPKGLLGPGRAKANDDARWLDLITIADGKRVPMVKCEGLDHVWRCAWSPDGKRVAYLPRVQSFPEIHDKLTVSNADGSGVKVIFEADHALGANIDWR